MWGRLRIFVPRLALLAALLITSAQAQTSALSDVDALRYIASHGDLIQLYGADPAKGRAHYQEYGVKEGRRITFDPLSYVATHPDLIEIIGVNEEKATRHYINFGFQEKRATTGFNALAYIASYLDLMDTFGVDSVKATRHYIEFGFKEGRRIAFNALSYIASHSDLIAAFGIDEVTGTRHFIQFGFKEGRRVSFDPSVYLSLHSDLQSAFGKDLVAATKHYIQFGFKEGRATVGQPIIQLSPSSIDFGSVQQGSSSPIRTILVANVGTAPLTISRISVGGASGNQFSQTNNCSSIGAGGSCTISVTFTPTSTGSKSAFISLVYNASGSPANVSLSGVASPTLASSVLVDIDSIKNATTDKSGITFKSGSSALRVFLVAGSYDIQPVGPASEGKYVALEFCACNVSPRKYSWVYDYRTSSNASPKRIASLGGPIGNGQDYYDANQALRDAPTEKITLSQDGWIEFFLYDTVIDDNIGGVSVKVVPSGVTSLPASISDLDALRYIASHSDLIEAFGADPAKGRSHYEQLGATEGRKITFNPLSYTASHRDLIEAFGVDEAKAVTHYIRFGFKEGRKIIFDPAVYLALHTDLRAVFGTDLTAAVKHYIQFGFKEGRATAGQPIIQLTPASLDLGRVVQSASSPVRTVIIANVGNLPLVVAQVSIGGVDAAQFSQTNNCASVAAGGSCAINVTFRPTSAGAKSASLAISHNASSSPAIVSLSGTATAAATPLISVNPIALSFSQAVNTASSAQTVTVSNTGNATLTVSGVSLIGSDAAQFSQTNNCASVAAGGSCAINVTFRPTSAGAKSASLAISHNASSSPAIVSLSGTDVAVDVPRMFLTPGALTFNQLINTKSPPQSITILNVGRAPLNISNIAVSGTNASLFSQTNNCSIVPVAQSCTISVTFSPTSLGAKSATISITSNSGGVQRTESGFLALVGIGEDKSTVTIVARYQRPGQAQIDGSAPQWTAPVTAVIPNIWVELWTPSGELHAAGYADNNGRITFRTLKPDGTYIPVLKSRAFTGSYPNGYPASGFDLWVVDNTLRQDGSSFSRQRYPLHSLAFSPFSLSPTESGQTFTVTATLGWDAVGKALDDSKRFSAPFAIIADVIRQQTAVSAVGATNKVNRLTILWSPKNRGGLIDGEAENYDLGIVSGAGAFYSSCAAKILSSGVRSGCQEEALARDIPEIWLSGSQTFEVMEFSTQVIAHELTHFTQAQSQRNFSPGGSHSFGDFQDITLVHHEGFATGAATLIAESPKLERLFPSGGRIVSSFDDYSKVSPNSPLGWFQERTFATFIWRLFDPAGSIRLSASDIYAPYYSSSWKNGFLVPNIWAYGKILKDLQPSKSSAIDSLGATLNITLAGNDVMGSTEMISGIRTERQTFPVVATLPLNGSIQLCSAGKPYEYNKMSNRRYFRVLGDGRDKVYKITGPSDTVPYSFIFTTTANDRGFELFSKGSRSTGRVLPSGTGTFWGYITECTVGRFGSSAEENGSCGDVPYTPPLEQCWTITVEPAP
jgi:hypothetical protein